MRMIKIMRMMKMMKMMKIRQRWRMIRTRIMMRNR